MRGSEPDDGSSAMNVCLFCAKILDTVPCAVALATDEGRLFRVNRAFLDMWRLKDADDAKGRLVTVFFESRTIAANVVDVLARSGTWNGELVAKRADGSRFRVRMESNLERTGGDRTRCMILAFTDISEQIQIQESLKTGNERCRALAECVSDWIWEVDHQGVYVYSNPNVRDILGYEPGEILGKTPFDFMPEAEALRHRREFQIHVDSRSPFRNLENINLHRDGHEVILESSGVPVTDTFGRFCGFRGIDRDITVRTRVALMALRKARNDLEIKVAERTRALRNASNESRRLHRNLETVFSSISDAIITVDRDMRVVNKNQALREICARAGDMVVGDPLDRAFDLEEHSPCLHLLREVMEKKEVIRGYRAECHCGLKANQVTMLNASPVMDSRGGFAGAVLVVRDVTRPDELERSLDERTRFQHIIGKSKSIRDIFAVLEQLKDLKTTVLITGESGAGKEMIVDALHYASSSITGPLVKVNCAALAENLLESELFGHVRGAFTGAVQDKIGRFQAAEGGTIFLDEIGDISPSIQLKLLRVLECKEFERVGDSTTRTADVRVVAATNMALQEKVQQGLFRKDLYYRLRVMVIDVPTLRERSEDIPMLTDHFIAKFARAFGKDLHGVTDEVMHTFMHYPWPGNVRELKHTIEHASILCRGGPIATHHLPRELIEFASGQRLIAPLSVNSDRTERDRYLSALEQSRWNKSRAAELLGISRTTLYRKMEELGVSD